ncbi:MAG: phosphodiesterase [Pseudomonadales bacterium]|nr:phosphodiesterase [Pseudomonadales bacterium]
MLLSYSSLSIAESIAVPVGQQGAANQNIERPARGSSKSQVSNQFGNPKQQTASIGEPPISQWEYDNFTVYFEDDHAIHSVLHP